MKRRPNPPKSYEPNADDYDTRTKYAIEYCLGDAMKVILLQLYDMYDFENLQKHEMLGLISACIDTHLPGALEEFED
jgi:hypothetical protein